MTAATDNSTAARALAAAGDHDSARDVAALDGAARGVERKLAATRTGARGALGLRPGPDARGAPFGCRACATRCGLAARHRRCGARRARPRRGIHRRCQAVVRATPHRRRGKSVRLHRARGVRRCRCVVRSARRGRRSAGGERFGSPRGRDLRAADHRRRLAACLRRRAAAADVLAARSRRPADGVRPHGGRRRRQCEEDSGVRRAAGRRQLSFVCRRRGEQALDHECRFTVG